jgi:hypothetical protein
MENIYIYADFDFLEQAEEIGVLSYERVRGNDHFASLTLPLNRSGKVSNIFMNQEFNA